MSAGVMVAYNGVHQAYQIALAAGEAGVLDEFICSLIDAPGKWGRIVAAIAGSERMRSYRVPALRAESVTEFPWPNILNGIRAKVRPSSEPAWIAANEWFDRWTAEKVKISNARVFVGSETCARDCFTAARERGMKRVLDAPQLHPAFLEDILRRAGKDNGIDIPGPIDPARLSKRKQEEFDAADWLLVYSNVHRQSFVSAGYGEKQFFQCPLWVDSAFWAREPQQSLPGDGRLKILFAGSINLRKGIPYLLRAIRLCRTKSRVTLVGPISPALRPVLDSNSELFSYAGTTSKNELRRLYSEHDLFVLPSLADSFGFVALEAMACGLPVVVTDNCGAPVPEPSWRVPVMDSDAIARRIEFYEGDRAALKRDAELAVQFARQFTPERYREEIKRLLARLLGSEKPGANPPFTSAITNAR